MCTGTGMSELSEQHTCISTSAPVLFHIPDTKHTLLLPFGIWKLVYISNAYQLAKSHKSCTLNVSLNFSLK